MRFSFFAPAALTAAVFLAAGPALAQTRPLDWNSRHEGVNSNTNNNRNLNLNGGVQFGGTASTPGVGYPGESEVQCSDFRARFALNQSNINLLGLFAAGGARQDPLLPTSGWHLFFAPEARAR